MTKMSFYYHQILVTLPIHIFRINSPTSLCIEYFCLTKPDTRERIRCKLFGRDSEALKQRDSRAGGHLDEDKYANRLVESDHIMVTIEEGFVTMVTVNSRHSTSSRNHGYDKIVGIVRATVAMVTIKKWT